MRSSVLFGVAVVCAGLVAPLASADMESQSLDFEFALSPNSATLSFDQFDDMGGTRILKKVSVLFTGNMGADITAENDSILPAPDFAVGISGFLTLDISDASLFVAIDESFASGGVDATDGVPGSGPDFHDFGSVMTGDDDDTSLDSDLADFIGAGTIDADIFASGGFSITGSTDATLNLTNFAGWGKVEIIYTYNLVPAPGALAIFGMALAGTGRRRRH